MDSVASREILWNVHSLTGVVIMYALMALSMIVAGIGIVRHAEMWLSGKPANQTPRSLFERMRILVTWGALQRGTVREPGPALAHSLVYLGFLVLTFTTTMVLIENDFGIKIYRGNFYLAVTLLSDIFGFGLLVGCALFAHRRYIVKADLLHNRQADWGLLSILVLLVVQGFLLEGLRIHATNDPWAAYSPIGNLVAEFFWRLSPEATRGIHFITWWFHTITVFFGLAVLPYSKLFHILVSPANLFFKDTPRPRGALESAGDLEKLMETSEDFSIGLGTIKDYSWKHLLDLDACTSCGRCQDNCPAYLSGKPLSPKWVVLDTRNHALALHSKGELVESRIPKPLVAMDQALNLALMLPSHGLTPVDGGGFTGAGSYRADNPLVQQAVRVQGKSVDQRIAGDVMDPAVFWSCTTCYACVEVCPVGINHVDQIIGNRRNMTLMQGEIPHEAQGTLRALENRANPYGDPKDRINWLDGIEVKILEPGDSVDYLYWVGCVSAYDPRKQKIARALTKIMKRAGLSFGILGTTEGCTGDPARRLGEENLFQTLAKSNLEVLRSVRFKNLVANCPHCFNTIKNEYPQFGNLQDGSSPNIIHHSVLLRKLLQDGQIQLKEVSDDFPEITFHDPCYLGRYNGEYEAPRETLKKVKGLQILEMDRSKEKGMCCGAGGGHFWMDLKVGDRVNALRTDQAAATGASTIATACPFCMQMMEDGVKLTNREESMDVRDIAEVIAERLE